MKVKIKNQQNNNPNNAEIYYTVWCDDATSGDNTDLTFSLDEWDKMILWVDECKANNWDYNIYIETFKGEDEDIIHLAELNI